MYSLSRLSYLSHNHNKNGKLLLPTHPYSSFQIFKKTQMMCKPPNKQLFILATPEKHKPLWNNFSCLPKNKPFVYLIDNIPKRNVSYLNKPTKTSVSSNNMANPPGGRPQLNKRHFSISTEFLASVCVLTVLAAPVIFYVRGYRFESNDNVFTFYVDAIGLFLMFCATSFVFLLLLAFFF